MRRKKLYFNRVAPTDAFDPVWEKKRPKVLHECLMFESSAAATDIFLQLGISVESNPRGEATMRRKRGAVYNVLFPIWLILWIPSWLWLAVIPANLGVDCLVAWVALRHMGVEAKRVLKAVWWKFWLLGFLADFVGAAVLLGLTVGCYGPGDAVPSAFLTGIGNAMMHNAFENPLALALTLACVALSGVCIYFWDRRVARSTGLLNEAACHKLALAMAITTAPWLYFVPLRW